MARRFWVYRRATAICLRSKPGTWHGTSRLESVPGWWLTYPSEKSWLYNVIYHIWQVVLSILKNMKVSWDDEIPNIWKNKSHVPNHQPGSGAGSSCYIFWCKDPPMAQNAQSTVHKKMLTFQMPVVEKWLNWTRKVQPNKTILQKQEDMPYYMNGLKDPCFLHDFALKKRYPNKPLSILGTHLTKLIVSPFECLYILEFCCANTPILAGLPWFISTRVIVLYGPLLAAEPPFLLVVSCCIPSSPSIGHTRSCTCSTRMFVW